MSLEAKNSESLIQRDIVDGYTWSVLPTDQIAEAGLPVGQIEVHQSTEDFSALAARRLILAEMARNRGTIDQLETLDYLHALAVERGIVTPYSSMIVLINKAQEQKLEKLSAHPDRFEREYEDLGETTPTPQAPLSGVPEPHEWLLIGIAAAILLWYANRKRGILNAMIVRSN